jgi:uncharacterized LabA/DUF88 family protein
MAVQLNPYTNGIGAFPQYQRVMVFIDGENLTLRFKEMLKGGSIANTEVIHKEDTYAWSENSIQIEGLYEIIRASYYTYTIGPQEAAISLTSNEIKNLKFNRHLGSQMHNKLHPVVFWKSQSSRKGKGVDIQLTVDALIHAFENNFDIFYLVSGDGDFAPLVKEIIRKGKQVYVAALSSGLNENLKYTADVFVSLDSAYFQNT